MRAMWQSLVQFAESPIVQTTSGVVLKAGTATGVSESFEDFVLHGKIDDAITIIDDCMKSGQTAGAAFVAIWLAGFTGLEESTVGKRIFSTGKGLDQQNLTELRGALASIKENPQALAKIELGMRQSFVDDWVGQSIAAGALNTSLVKKASIAAETAQHDLQTVQGTLQQKEFAVGNSINDLDAAVNKMLTSDGTEWEKAKQEVLNCVQSLKARKTELAEVQELVGPRQQTADNANDALLKEQNIVLSGLRIQGEKMYDAQGGAGNEVQEGNGLTTPAAQETNELAETEDNQIDDDDGAKVDLSQEDTKSTVGTKTNDMINEETMEKNELSEGGNTFDEETYSLENNLGDLDWDFVVSKKGETRVEHVKRHLTPMNTREIHGVFYGDPLTIINEAWSQRGKSKKVIEKNGGLIYNIPYENAGYESGYKNTGAQLDYVTIVVMKNTSQIVTAFPSDGEYGKEEGN